MAKCSWCGSESDNMVTVGKDKVCEKCYKSYSNDRCIECGGHTVKSMLVKGRCLTCIQIAEAKKSEDRDAEMSGDSLMSNMIEGMSDEEYQNWLCGNAKFDSRSLQDPEMLRMTIIFKLQASGITDQRVISRNYQDAERLIKGNMDKFVGHPTTLTVVSAKDRERIKDKKVLAKRGNVVLLEGNE